jgi:hypothetical protein
VIAAAANVDNSVFFIITSIVTGIWGRGEGFFFLFLLFFKGRKVKGAGRKVDGIDGDSIYIYFSIDEVYISVWLIDVLLSSNARTRDEGLLLEM